MARESRGAATAAMSAAGIMRRVDIKLTYGSETYQRVVAATLPGLLVQHGVDAGLPYFITAEERDRHPVVNIIGPNNFGHWATLEVRSGDDIMAPESNDIPDGATAVLALYEPELFFEH